MPEKTKYRSGPYQSELRALSRPYGLFDKPYSVAQYAIYADEQTAHAAQTQPSAAHAAQQFQTDR